MKHLLDYHQFIQNLIWKNVLDRRRDVFGIQNADYVILLGGSGELLETRKRLDKLLQEIEREAVWNAAVSSPCRNMEEVSEGMKEVSVLRNRRGGMIQNLEEHTCRMQYLMGRFTVHDGARTVVRDAPQAGRPARGKTGGAAITDSSGVLRIRRKCRKGGGKTESA